jgi:hypothetical protein
VQEPQSANPLKRSNLSNVDKIEKDQQEATERLSKPKE